MSKNQKPDLSIVIPALREEKRIGKTLRRLSEFINSDSTLKDLKIEVVVVSADSPDRTHEIVEDHKLLFNDLRLFKPGPKVGKGRDVKHGVLHSKGKAILFMDADLATPLKYLTKFYDIYSSGEHVIVATRNLKKHHRNIIRRMISIGGNTLFRVAGGLWIEDSQCGFKMFSHDAAMTCFTKATILGWGFDMEILAIAKANNLNIVTVRVNDWKNAPGSTFEVSLLKNSLSTLLDLAKIANHRLRGAYK